jgi:lysyl-tRNA synthetase class 1
VLPGPDPTPCLVDTDATYDPLPVTTTQQARPAGGIGGDWVAEIADRVLEEADRRGSPVVCASGISPSGPIHLGNLREIFVPHLVADEIRRRGRECTHVLSWDDYDRLRKVPSNAPASFSEHIGRALSSVPDPFGDHESWAEHFKAALRQALAALGVELTEISQTERYTSGAYTHQVLQAMAARREIDAVLGRHRTAKTVEDEDDDEATPRGGYYPYRAYCETCGRDSTTVTAYDDRSTSLAYSCSCGHAGSIVLAERSHGKLVWKVDWPMRWAYEGVTFEAGGVDHSSPGSSFTVGTDLVAKVFGGLAPLYEGYSFVGTREGAKMSGSAGGVPTPSDALEIIEAPILRWLYARKRPRQAFTIAFDQEVVRLYDEWDSTGARVAGGSASPSQQAAYLRSVATAGGPLEATPRPFSFGTLAAIQDVTSCNDEQTLRIVRQLAPDDPVGSLDELLPRLERARAWVAGHMPAEERTKVREAPDGDLLTSLSPPERQSLARLCDQMAENWDLPRLTRLVYGIPKLQAGLALDDPPTDEVKASQRAFFALVYNLLVGKDTGPRLPTLLLSIGAERARALIGCTEPASS